MNQVTGFNVLPDRILSELKKRELFLSHYSFDQNDHQDKNFIQVELKDITKSMTIKGETAKNIGNGIIKVDFDIVLWGYDLSGNFNGSLNLIGYSGTFKSIAIDNTTVSVTAHYNSKSHRIVFLTNIKPAENYIFNVYWRQFDSRKFDRKLVNEKLSEIVKEQFAVSLGEKLHEIIYGFKTLFQPGDYPSEEEVVISTPNRTKNTTKMQVSTSVPTEPPSTDVDLTKPTWWSESTKRWNQKLYREYGTTPEYYYTGSR